MLGSGKEVDSRDLVPGAGVANKLGLPKGIGVPTIITIITNYGLELG